MSETRSAPTAARVAPSAWSLVGALVVASIASGVLQGFYSPLYSDLSARLHVAPSDLTWLDAVHLGLATLAVPPLGRLGDLIGRKQVLLATTLVVAVTSWTIAFTSSYHLLLVVWAVQGVYVVWLPLQLAIISRRARLHPGAVEATTRAVALLVAAIEMAIIVAALVAGRLADGGHLTLALGLPAAVVTVAVVVLWRGVPATPAEDAATFDWAGLALLTVMVGLFMGGLAELRRTGAGAPWGWLLLAASVVVVVPWWRYEARCPAPVIGLHTLVGRRLWPLQLAALLAAVPLLGAQVAMSTYQRAAPAKAGFGLGLTASQVSDRLAVYVLCLAVGALLTPILRRGLGTFGALALGGFVYGVAYLCWLPFHAQASTTLLLMATVGVGAGVLQSGIPAAIVASVPPQSAGAATGAMDGLRSLGGAIGSGAFAVVISAHPSLDGYRVLWIVCAATGLLAGTLLVVAQRRTAYAAVGEALAEPA